MSADVSQRAQSIIESIAGWGITPEIQKRLGVFGIVWGMFETSLENAVLSLRNEQIGPGIRPSTDATPIADWIKVLGQPSPRIPEHRHALMEYASLTATDLMEYRHAIVHGSLVPATRDMPSEFSDQERIIRADIESLVIYSGLTREVFGKLPEKKPSQ